MMDALPVAGPEDPRRWLLELPEALEERFRDEPHPGRMLIAPGRESAQTERPPGAVKDPRRTARASNLTLGRVRLAPDRLPLFSSPAAAA